MSNEEKRNRRLDACLAAVLETMDAEEGAVFRAYALKARSREPGAHEEALATLVTEFVELQVRRHGGADPEGVRAYARELFESDESYRSLLAVLHAGSIRA